MVELKDIDNVICPQCRSEKTVKNGTRKTVNKGVLRKRICRTCGTNYSSNASIKYKNKQSSDIVILAVLKMSEKLSLRETATTLKKTGIDVSYQTIANWRKKFMSKTSKNTVLTKETEQTKDPDWMYKPMLQVNTRTDYDGNKIDADWSGD